MNELTKKLFAVRKDGENGEKCFITLGDIAISKKLHDTEKEAFDEIRNVDIETLSRVVVAIMEAVEKMINDKKETEK